MPTQYYRGLGFHLALGRAVAFLVQKEKTSKIKAAGKGS